MSKLFEKTGVVFVIHGRSAKDSRMGVLMNRFPLPPGNLLRSWEDIEHNIVDSIVGMVEIAPPEGPCRGAWEVIRAAGPGKGSMVYGLGYFLSPTGKLISDRGSLTGSAVKAWMKVRSKIEGEALDDISSPRNSDPNDDCELWVGGEEGEIGSHNENPGSVLTPGGADAVNRAYSVTPKYDFGSMIDRGQKWIRVLSKEDQIRWKTSLSYAASRFFSNHW